MSIPNEQFFWQRFCETGSVEDYLAYRQMVNQRRNSLSELDGEDMGYADYYRRDSDSGAEYR